MASNTNDINLVVFKIIKSKITKFSQKLPNTYRALITYFWLHKLTKFTQMPLTLSQNYTILGIDVSFVNNK